MRHTTKEVELTCKFKKCDYYLEYLHITELAGTPTETTLLDYYIYVNGFWIINQIITLGLFHFIGPANGYTCTLHIHSAINRLGLLVYFLRASIADSVNS